MPTGGLTLDSAGNLYGTTELGGATGSGTVVELSPPVLAGGGGWTETILETVGDTAFLGGRLIFDNAGNLYGVGCDPDTGGNCLALELSRSSGGAWTETALVTLPTDPDFGKAVPNLIFDTAGNLYGVSGYGFGVGAPPGTVFKLTHSTTGWTGEVIHHFIGSDGFDPTAITFDSAGNLFGITGSGGHSNWGVGFKLTPNAGGDWVESKVHEFSGGADGAFPEGIIAGGDGNLYGTTLWGGSGTGEVGLGVVFELKP